MFEKAFEKIRNFLHSLDERRTELKSGLIVDALSEETFPARSDLAAVIDPTFTPFDFGSLLGPNIVMTPPLWHLRFQTAEGNSIEVSLDEGQRRMVIESLRDQVARDGVVSSIPLPNLSDWGDGRTSEHR